MLKKLTPAELPRLAACAREFYAASRFLGRFEMDRFVDLWTRLIESGTGVVFAIDLDGALVGTIGGVVYPEAYSGDLVASEFFWYALPEHRGAGIRLYRAFEDWARFMQCSQIRMVHLQDSMPEKLQRVYQHLGFVAAEVHYVKELS